MEFSMAEYALPFDPETLDLDPKAAKAAGEKYGPAYQSKTPFHYGCIDDFMPPEILDRVIEELRTLPDAEAVFDRPQERFKASYIPERLPPYTKQLFYALNSRPVIQFLEALTGIKGLIPDPYYQGGGVHVTGTGGHLDIHADFNHHKTMNLERRLNILIYLNKDWKEEYGGSFEVWSENMEHKVAGFEPIFNRMCCFSTSSKSWHGNPEPVNHPDGKPRMSLALYYYTATWDSTRKAHTTLFKPRPGTADREDKVIARRAWLKDVLPPVVYRRVAHRMKSFGF